ncbi:uncharacterized protein V1518DRAFT_411652 [Limtongia smithiae]|uniref:uncharacterized protein n=1 Tax=Limtongia smithiae TaxID=1125753 RepID=UPI0034CFFA36
MTTLPDPETLQPTTELQNLSRQQAAPDGHTRQQQQITSPPGQQDAQSQNDGSAPPVEEPSELVKAAQSNNVAVVDRLISSGECTVGDVGSDGATALHWAAINNSTSVALYLLDHGADVNCKGGELKATPLLWACRAGLSSMSYLLIQHGADPLRTDIQGFNALDVAVHSSNTMLVLYLLYQGLPVDCTDPHQRTPLHWAAYQGDAMIVDVLVHWGADVKLKDVTGFTALHWAAVRGNAASMRSLIEAGSDVKAETNDGKTAASIAREMMCFPAWKQALKTAGRYEDGSIIPNTMSIMTVNRIMFFWPWAVLGIAFTLLSSLNVFSGLVLASTFVVGSHMLLTRIVKRGRAKSVQFHNSPYLSGLFAGSAFWVAVRWIFFVLPATFEDAWFMNIIFFIMFGFSMYFYTKGMLMDPGYIPKPKTPDEQLQMIDDLFEVDQYDAQHFCIQCYTRRPLRSKHCRVCGKCVARMDHHCPWINNCVGLRNHRSFLLYVILLEVAIPMFVYLVYEYLPDVDDDLKFSCIFISDEEICRAVSYDPFTLIMAVWASIQMTWVSFLNVVQLYQVSRGVTTNEAFNLHRFGWMGGAGDDVPAPTGLADPFDANAGTTSPTSHTHRGPRGSIGLCMRLIGIPQFLDVMSEFIGGSKVLSWISSSATSGAAQQRRERQSALKMAQHANPFNGGCISNCKDFWDINDGVIKTKLADNGPYGGHGKIKGTDVDYYKLWTTQIGSTGSEMTASSVSSREDGIIGDTMV